MAIVSEREEYTEKITQEVPSFLAGSNIIQFIDALMSGSIEVDNILIDLKNATQDLEIATSEQLDFIGNRIGISRRYPTEPLQFGFGHDTRRIAYFGIGSYGSRASHRIVNSVNFLEFSDANFIRYIRARIRSLSGNCDIQNYYQALSEFFENVDIDRREESAGSGRVYINVFLNTTAGLSTEADRLYFIANEILPRITGVIYNVQILPLI